MREQEPHPEVPVVSGAAGPGATSRFPRGLLRLGVAESPFPVTEPATRIHLCAGGQLVSSDWESPQGGVWALGHSGVPSSGSPSCAQVPTRNAGAAPRRLPAAARSGGGRHTPISRERPSPWDSMWQSEELRGSGTGKALIINSAPVVITDAPRGDSPQRVWVRR